MIELGNLHQLYVKGFDKLTPTNIVTQKPWIAEPSGSDPFDAQGAINLPTFGFGAPPSLVVAYQVPKGYDGVINALSNNIYTAVANLFVQGDGSIIWSLMINKRAVHNFDSVIVEKGTIQIARPISPLRIFSGDLVEWFVLNVSSVLAGARIICSINGYVYPSKGAV